MEDRGPREKLFPGDDQGVIFNLSQLDLGARGLGASLKPPRLGFRLQGLSRATGRWEPIESRAELPLGMVLTRDQLWLSPSLYSKHQDIDRTLEPPSNVSGCNSLVKSQGTLQPIVFGVFAFIGVCPILLWVFFKRSVYGWYYLYLFGGWLVVWVAAPGNSTVPFWAKRLVSHERAGVSCSLLGFFRHFTKRVPRPAASPPRVWAQRCRQGLIIGLLPGLMLLMLLETLSGLMLQCLSFVLVPYLLFNKRSSDLGARLGFLDQLQVMPRRWLLPS